VTYEIVPKMLRVTFLVTTKEKSVAILYSFTLNVVLVRRVYKFFIRRLKRAGPSKVQYVEL